MGRSIETLPVSFGEYEFNNDYSRPPLGSDLASTAHDRLYDKIVGDLKLQGLVSPKSTREAMSATIGFGSQLETHPEKIAALKKSIKNLGQHYPGKSVLFIDPIRPLIIGLNESEELEGIAPVLSHTLNALSDFRGDAELQPQGYYLETVENEKHERTVVQFSRYDFRYKPADFLALALSRFTLETFRFRIEDTDLIPVDLQRQPVQIAT